MEQGWNEARWAVYEDARVRGLCHEGALEVARQAKLMDKGGAVMDLRVKRVYEEPEDNDGTRILVDRVWPRGVSKERAQVHLWLKEIAPSSALRKWFGHDPDKWAEFKTRYWRELDEKREALETIRAEAEKGPVTLVFAARDKDHNNAVALAEYLKNGGRRSSTDGR